MATTGDIQVRIHCSTWRFRVTLTLARWAVCLSRSEGVAAWLLRWFNRNAIRLISFRVESA
jgi:hypothetical protein